MAGLQYGEGHMTINSVVWERYINVTDTETHRQPHRHGNRRPETLRADGKKYKNLLTPFASMPSSLAYHASSVCSPATSTSNNHHHPQVCIAGKGRSVVLAP